MLRPGWTGVKAPRARCSLFFEGLESRIDGGTQILAAESHQVLHRAPLSDLFDQAQADVIRDAGGEILPFRGEKEVIAHLVEVGDVETLAQFPRHALQDPGPLVRERL